MKTMPVGCGENISGRYVNQDPKAPVSEIVVDGNQVDLTVNGEAMTGRIACLEGEALIYVNENSFFDGFIGRVDADTLSFSYLGDFDQK
jgi:hypothetical protein